MTARPLQAACAFLAGVAFMVWACTGSTVAGVLCIVATVNVLGWEAGSATPAVCCAGGCGADVSGLCEACFTRFMAASDVATPWPLSPAEQRWHDAAARELIRRGAPDITRRAR